MQPQVPAKIGVAGATLAGGLTSLCQSCSLTPEEAVEAVKQAQAIVTEAAPVVVTVAPGAGMALGAVSTILGLVQTGVQTWSAWSKKRAGAHSASSRSGPST